MGDALLIIPAQIDRRTFSWSKPLQEASVAIHFQAEFAIVSNGKDRRVRRRVSGQGAQSQICPVKSVGTVPSRLPLRIGKKGLNEKFAGLKMLAS
jgi:hypothetical protein